jgi:hypothetical protein
MESKSNDKFKVYTKDTKGISLNIEALNNNDNNMKDNINIKKQVKLV